MILIFGSNGMLGSYIFSYLKDNFDIKVINRDSFDVYSLFKENNIVNELEKILKNIKPNYIINCIGNILKVDDDLNKKYIVNSYFPLILSKICKKYNIILIHPTTDCVYSGDGPVYDENSIPEPIDDYGLSKFLGENIDACVIRTSIIGEEIYNNRSLINWVKNNNNNCINGYTNHYWNGITCLEYAKIVEEIIKNKSHWKGIKIITSNYKNNNFITKYELLKIIIDIYNLNIIVTPFETEKKCDRRLKGCICDTDLHDQLIELKIYNLKNKL